MTSLPEQFSAARQTQIDNGIKFMRSVSEQALERTSRVLALQIGASRAALEQSSNTVRQLLAVRDPRDLLALGSQTQQQLRSFFDYGRELFSIAAGVNLPPLRFGSATPILGAPATDGAATQQHAEDARAAAEAFDRTGARRTGGDTASAIASAAASTASPAPASAAPSIILQADAPAEATQAHTAADLILPAETPAPAPVEIVTSRIEPSVEPTTIAKVTSEALETPVAPPHPLAASMPVEVAVEIELPKIEPLEAAPPPPAPTTGPVETRGTKGRKKQH